jgi:hypothetical protein
VEKFSLSEEDGHQTPGKWSGSIRKKKGVSGYWVNDSQQSLPLLSFPFYKSLTKTQKG